VDAIRLIFLDEDITSSYVEPPEVKEEFLRLAKVQRDKIEQAAELQARHEGVFTTHDRDSFLQEAKKRKAAFEKSKVKFLGLFKIKARERPEKKIETAYKKEVQDVVKERRKQIGKGQTNIDIDNFSTDANETNYNDQDAASVEVKSFWRTAIDKFLNLFFGGGVKHDSFLSKDVVIGTNLLSQENIIRMSKDNYYEKSAIDTTLLTKESIKLRNILRGKSTSKRKSFLIGPIANLMVRNISSWLIKRFPNFFEVMYNGIRLANLKMLSSTYVNVMVFCCILSLIIGTLLSFVVFGLIGLPFIVVFVRALFFGIIASTITFAIFYGYPFNRIKERRRNIKTNISFAISHMAAVSGSGVPPFSMFQLLAQSPEYGEVTVEIQRVVDYCNLFGYDLIISIRSVAATTPSPDLKEFLSGLVSSIESGGDLKTYLIEKSKDAFSSYELERQKFNEIISTYSDIYTGILIAAPLFFISALALIGLLGGQVGGINIKILVGVGIYVVIPVMNIAFILFLEMTQPEV
jgi:flagellar protein FlaJ